MKQLVLLAFFVIPSFLFSYEIAFNKSFSTKLKGDIITTSVNINIEDQRESVINKKVEKFNRFFKKEKEIIKKGGSFSLNPRYKYYNNKQIFLKYVGSLRYTLESKDAKELNGFVQKLINFKEDLDDKKIKLNISNISWTVSKTQEETTIEKLKLDSIKWAESYGKDLSKELDKDCEVKKININSRFSNPPVMYKSMAMADSTSLESSQVAPINTKKDINLTASYIMECE